MLIFSFFQLFGTALNDVVYLKDHFLSKIPVNIRRWYIAFSEILNHYFPFPGIKTCNNFNVWKYIVILDFFKIEMSRTSGSLANECLRAKDLERIQEKVERLVQERYV